MATNEVFEDGANISIAVSHPASPVSGDPVRIGTRGGVATTDERTDGTTSVTLVGVHRLSVKGENNAGNSAVAVGDKLYYEDAATPVINKDNVAGFAFGYALEVVNAGATTTIRVLLGTF